MNPAKDVDAYIAGAATEARPILNELRRVIKSTLPDADESISWGVPFYRYQGLLGGFAAYKNHVSFSCSTNAVEPETRTKLEAAGYKLGKGTLQIKFDQKVPVTAIRQIVRTKARMNRAKAAG